MLNKTNVSPEVTKAFHDAVLQNAALAALDAVDPDIVLELCTAATYAQIRLALDESIPDEFSGIADQLLSRFLQRLEKQLDINREQLKHLILIAAKATESGRTAMLEVIRKERSNG